MAQLATATGGDAAATDVSLWSQSGQVCDVGLPKCEEQQESGDNDEGEDEPSHPAVPGAVVASNVAKRVNVAA